MVGIVEGAVIEWYAEDLEMGNSLDVDIAKTAKTVRQVLRD